LASLLRAKRELYPPDAEELAEIAFRKGITPDDFLQAIESMQQQDVHPTQ
jgi:hypothetical protein